MTIETLMINALESLVTKKGVDEIGEMFALRCDSIAHKASNNLTSQSTIESWIVSVMILHKIPLVFSVWPFALGWYGVVSRCLILYFSVNNLMTSLTK